MLAVIFIEISIAVITFLGCVLLISKYLKQKRRQDLYAFFVLLGVGCSDLSMVAAQVSFSLDQPLAYLGFKFFLYFIYLTVICIWLHMADIYNFKMRPITVFFSGLMMLSAALVAFSRAQLIINEGVIVPEGIGFRFALGFALLTATVAIESILAIVGLSRVDETEKQRYNTSKTAGLFLLVLFSCLAIYIITKLIYFYALTWLFAFLAMLFLFLFSMIPKGSPIVNYPLNFFRTRILFKLVITIMLMVVISLEGMGLISISIAKKALSESIIQNYRNIAEDSVVLINRTNISRGSEQNTLKDIEEVLRATKIGSRGSTFLISPSKTVYINRGTSWISLGEGDENEINKALSGKDGGGEIDLFGERVIAAYVPIKKLGWHMVIGQPIGFAYARINQMEGTYIIMLLFWIAATMVTGIMLARNVEEPVKELKKGITKISEGDLSYKIKVNKLDELGELASAINRMTDELKQSQESLIRSERLASLGYMAAGMAHEIKNALVPLRTLTDILSISGTDKEFIAKFNELVPKEIERINRLSTDLLHYSRPPQPIFEDTDLNGVIKEAAKFLDVQAKKNNITIKLKLSPISEVRADAQKVVEVLANLILNAIEAMRGGEITLTSREGIDDVFIEVSDNGPGIPPQNIDKIFVPFFTTKKEGTGMGLAITQRIMADHGGSIEVSSVFGQGSTFLLSFPKKS